MALPVILVDSATGSDTAASGAGPATALFGSSALSAADGLSVVLTTDNPDLSGVATDGSAVLFFNDTTAGNRNFAKITAVNNGTKVVTVANALGLTLTKAWAIGGKRSAIGTTLSKKLLDNNGAAGDARAGWAIEFQSGHTETIAANIVIRSSGDTTDGPLVIRGKATAATLPIITFSNNGVAFTGTGNAVQIRDFEGRNSNATKTASTFFTTGVGTTNVLRGLKISSSGSKFWKAIVISAADGVVVRDCEIGNTASHGIDTGGFATKIISNWIHDCGGDGINVNGAGVTGIVVQDNVIYGCAGDGMEIATSTANSRPPIIRGNVFTANTGDGLKISSTSAQDQAFNGTLIANNDFSNNGGFGVDFTGSGVTDILLFAKALELLNNNHYNNTSDTARLTSLGATSATEESTTNINPAYASPSTGDFTSTALREKGYPLGGTLRVGTYSLTYSYPDIGVQAHGPPLAHPGMSGRMGA